MTFEGLRYCTPVVIESVIRSWSNESLSLSRDTLSLDAQKWIIELALEPDRMGDKQAGANLSVHRARHQDGSSFTLPMPQHLGVPEVDATTLQVENDHAAGETSLPVRKVPGEPLIPIPKGRYFKFSGHDKIYQITEPTVFRGTGTVIETLNVFPALQENVADDEKLDFSPDITVIYAPDTLARIVYNNQILVRATLSLEEAV